MLREELTERLLRLDEDASLLYDDDRRFRMVIVGGSALILLDTITRATHDIDALNVPRELLGLLDKYDINTQAEVYINNFPYNYEDRVVKLPLDGKKIDFYSASLEDIVIAKLYSARSTDKRDIENENVLKLIDWDKLERLVYDEDEAKASALNDRSYSELKTSYQSYVERWKK